MRLTKYEKETILLTSEGDTAYSVYTFNAGLKRRLKEFGRKYPEHCRLERTTEEGSVTYMVDKHCLSIRLLAPVCEERRRAASEYARQYGIHTRAKDRDTA